MSAQTGAPAPSGPTSQRPMDRARFRLERLRSEPNPIWIRELRQAARLGRTPIVLSVLTVLMTLLICSIGGVMSAEASPATTGGVLFQVFFSVAYFVVTVCGPAVAANTIASEREGATWEAVLLTGLPPGSIARGKFLAAFTSVGMYVVMLAPVGALPFLFGGVTATEVVVAFVFLFLLAGLGVAFGLAISSKMESLRGAILVTLLLTFPITIAAFLTFGVGLSYAAHRAWQSVADGPPIWLPTAYQRAPFGADYMIFLVLLPVAALALPAWFLYEVTIANLTSATDDRSTGLKRWFLVAAPIFTLAGAVPLLTIAAGDRVAVAVSALTLLFLFLEACVFLFLGDPIGPSRRVTTHWDRIGASRFRRFLGPGIVRAAFLLLPVGTLGLATLTGVGALAVGTSTSGELSSVVAFGAYAVAFFVFTMGLGAFLRARSANALGARILLFAFLFGITVGPWVVAAIAGIVADHSAAREALVVAAPSPLFALVMADSFRRGIDALIVAGVAMMIVWAVAGLGLLASADKRGRRVVAEHEESLAKTDHLLAEEDAREAAAKAGTPLEPAHP